MVIMVLKRMKPEIISKQFQTCFIRLNHTKAPLINYQREYFYFIDLHGQLFLEETKPKNFTTCFKDVQFLNFFFKRIKFNDRVANGYSYLSLCGKEANFISADDTPIVFHDLVESSDLLKWGGNFEFPFQPNKLSVCTNTGRVYHPLPIDLKSQIHNLALLKSSLILTKLSNSINFEDMVINWKGKDYNIELVQLSNSSTK